MQGDNEPSHEEKLGIIRKINEMATSEIFFDPEGNRITAHEFGAWSGPNYSVVLVSSPQSNGAYQVKVGELTELPLKMIYVRRANDNGPASVKVKVRARDYSQPLTAAKVSLSDPELLHQLNEFEKEGPYYITSRSVNTATLCVYSDNLIELKDRHVKNAKITVRIPEGVFDRLPLHHLHIVPTVEVVGETIGVGSVGMNLRLTR